MIKVMFAPLNYGDVVQDGVVNAFRSLGCEVKVFDYMDRYLHCKDPSRVCNEFVNEASAFKPDLIHLQIQHTTIIDAPTIQKIKSILPNAIITNWTGDVRNDVPYTYKSIAAVADYNLISSTGQLEMFKNAIGKPVLYWQIGYNSDLYKPPVSTPSYFTYDAVFVGHYNNKESYPGTPTRLATCQMLQNEFHERFGLFGTCWPAPLNCRRSQNQRTVSEIYQQSVCSISVSHYNDLDHYFSDRLLMCMASGRPTISLRFPKWESYFTNMCDLVIVNDISEIPDKVRLLKNNPELANYIGASGAAKVFAEHTYYSRVKELFSLIGLM